MPRLIRIAVILCILSPLTAVLCARTAATTQVTGELVEIEVPAAELKDNLLGDPVKQKVAVYLPPGYESSPTRRFPSLYLLHGFLSNNRAWTNGYQGMNLQVTMDEMIKAGKIREMIVVVPNGDNAYHGGFYTNSSVNGNWEDYIYHELVQYIDTNYRTLARGESRGIAGHSMGGYGALMLAMRHPDVLVRSTP